MLVGKRLVHVQVPFIMLLVALCSQLAHSQQLDDSELFNAGYTAYNDKNYIDAALNLFSYIQRNPKELEANAQFAANVVAAYEYSRDELLWVEYQLSMAKKGASVSGVRLPAPELFQSSHFSKNRGEMKLYRQIPVPGQQKNIR